MISMRKTLACFAMVSIPLLWSLVGQPARVERKPLTRPQDEELEYKPTGVRVRLDPATRQRVTYDVEGKITQNKAAGTYTLEWTGLDGQKKTLNWVPPNKIAAEVAAEVNYDSKQHLFEYSYKLVTLCFLLVSASFCQELHN